MSFEGGRRVLFNPSATSSPLRATATDDETEFTSSRDDSDDGNRTVWQNVRLSPETPAAGPNSKEEDKKNGLR